MYLTNKHLSRRTVLRGMGVTLALPLLEAMTPVRSAFGAPATGRKIRFVGIEMVHGSAGSAAIGIKKNLWAPAAVGRGFDLSPSSLSSLEPFRDYVTIVSDTDLNNARSQTLAEEGADHTRSSSTFWPAVLPRFGKTNAMTKGELRSPLPRASLTGHVPFL